MSIEDWWKVSDWGKQKYWDTNLSQFHFFHRRSHVNGPGIETDPPRSEAGD
jgi:hypothetical protein